VLCSLTASPTVNISVLPIISPKDEEVVPARTIESEQKMVYDAFIGIRMAPCLG
jgi:hypothetical protein